MEERICERDMSFKSGVKGRGRGSDRWWERRWWLWWGDMCRMRWTRRTVNRMRLTEWRRELTNSVIHCLTAALRYWILNSFCDPQNPWHEVNTLLNRPLSPSVCRPIARSEILCLLCQRCCMPDFVTQWPLQERQTTKSRNGRWTNTWTWSWSSVAIIKRAGMWNGLTVKWYERLTDVSTSNVWDAVPRRNAIAFLNLMSDCFSR